MRLSLRIPLLALSVLGHWNGNRFLGNTRKWYVRTYVRSSVAGRCHGKPRSWIQFLVAPPFSSENGSLVRPTVLNSVWCRLLGSRVSTLGLSTLIMVTVHLLLNNLHSTQATGNTQHTIETRTDCLSSHTAQELLDICVLTERSLYVRTTELTSYSYT